jgi:prephenate dehydratase
VVSVRDRVGALLPFLAVFEEEGITLTKIESRMLTSRAREVLFYIDLRGHVSDSRLRRALERLEGTTKVLRVLGSYPAQG